MNQNYKKNFYTTYEISESNKITDKTIFPLSLQ